MVLDDSTSLCSDHLTEKQTSLQAIKNELTRDQFGLDSEPMSLRSANQILVLDRRTGGPGRYEETLGQSSAIYREIITHSIIKERRASIEA